MIIFFETLIEISLFSLTSKMNAFLENFVFLQKTNIMFEFKVALEFSNYQSFICKYILSINH
jgi:hypothetical protein